MKNYKYILEGLDCASCAKKVEDKINTNNVKSKEKFQNKDQAKTEDDEVKFLAKAMQILSEEYKLDSQGMYEYMKEIVDIRIGSEGREKIWKKIEGNTNESPFAG